MEIQFKNKYLKYKNKYLELKNSLSAGAYPFSYGIGTKFSIMAILGDDTLARVNGKKS